MKSDMKIFLRCGNLSRECMLSINGRIHVTQKHMNIREKTQIGLHIHHTMHNCQYTSFLGFAKRRRKIDHDIMIIV
jgi:hypothetical protein